MSRWRGGVTGAADGPEGVWKALAQAFPDLCQRVEKEVLLLEQYNLDPDQSTLEQQKDATVHAHRVITEHIQKWCERGYLPVAIGGDHSITYPVFRGVSAANPGRRIGLVYIDAHFDMRELETYDGIDGLVSSGNAFRRILDDPGLRVSGRNVVVIGIHHSEAEIVAQMKLYAQNNGVTIFYEDQLDDIGEIIRRVTATAQEDTHGIYFSVDIDAVNKILAPGVSAPAENGLSEDQVRRLVCEIANKSPVLGFDIAEVSSRKRAWFGGKPNPEIVESEEEKQAKLEKTAELAAQIISWFLEAIEKE